MVVIFIRNTKAIAYGISGKQLIEDKNEIPS
jgi:hypothetical protein